MTFDNLTDFTNALPSGAVTTTDGFDNDIAQAQSITFDSGVVSTMITPPNPFFDDNTVSGGVFNNAVDGDGTAAAESITWTFPTEIIGFGFDIFNAQLGGVQITLDDGGGPETFAVFDELSGPISGFASGFVGFIGDNPFQSVTFTNGSIVTDEFDIDNLTFATAPTVVPLPAALPLFLAGLVGLGLARRRGKA